MTDQEMIEALRAKGYRVIEDKRVRIVSAQGFIDRKEMLRLPPDTLETHRRYVDESAARMIGHRLFEDGFVVRSRVDISLGEERRVQTMVVLPNTWDLDREMWGIRP
jgi:hypothetical protein